MSGHTRRSKTRTRTGTRNGRYWRLAKRFTVTALVAFWNLFDARNGFIKPFCFYDPYDISSKFSYYPTGVATVGRYVVRCNGDWQQSCGPGRSNANLELIELA